MVDDPKRDLVGYAGSLPLFRWPNGARIAVNLVVNYEEGAEQTPLDGDAQPESLMSEGSYPVPSGIRGLVEESIFEYGSRTAIWRLINLLDTYRAPATVFACARALELNAAVATVLTNRGCDFVGHGYRWKSPIGLAEVEERLEMREAIKSIGKLTGQRVRSWFPRSPHTASTRRLIAQEGLLYDSAAFNDDLPFFADVLGRPLLVIPYSLDTNDSRFWKGTFVTANDFATYCIDSFDWLYRESAHSARLMSVGLHPRIIGHPGRIVGLERFLSHIARKRSVWVAKRIEIAMFWLQQFAPSNVWNWRD